MELLSKYAYPFGSLIGILFVFLISIFRKDFRKRILINGFLTGILFIVLEYFYFQDYWNPPLIYQFGELGGIDDLFFGFAAGGLGVTIPDLLSKREPIENKNNYLWYLTAALLLIILVPIGWKIGINSIYSTSFGFLIISFYRLVTTPQLVKRFFFGSLLGALILAGGEAIFLKTISPDYLNKYFLLLGNVSIFSGVFIFTEILWGASFGAFISVIPRKIDE